MMALQQRLSGAAAEIIRSGPGLVLCVLLGALAVGLAGAIPIWGGSGVVYALLVGMLLAAVWSPPTICSAGIDAAAKPVLRIGVALLGTQISAQTLATLDLATIALLALSIIFILVAGVLLARTLGIGRELALVAAASVAICGASAAVAFALVLARPETRERDAACTVGAVSVLSTAAMLLYPALAQVLGLDPVATGIFLGATIQEVPHAVAAGYGVDPDVGNIATTTKLLRVALLGPALILVSAAVAGSAASNRVPTPYGFMPPFLIAFFAFAALNVAEFLPRIIVGTAGPLSRFFLITAMAAIGLKLPWRSVAAYGWRPVLLLTLLSGLQVLLVASYLLG
jgi:uncharacterized integral membrane protein (TIGR00698 family)